MEYGKHQMKDLDSKTGYLGRCDRYWIFGHPILLPFQVVHSIVANKKEQKRMKKTLLWKGKSPFA